MFFSPEFIEEVKRRALPSQVISAYVSLKKKNAGEFLGLCPFHNEKTPSFTVSDKRGYYHCFGCGAHGNVFNFLMENQGYQFVEAVKMLAEQVGVELPKQNSKEIEKYKKISSLYQVMELAANWFTKNLYKNTNYKELEYLKDRRGLNEKIIAEFALGFSPRNKGMLIDYLKKQHVSEADMIAAGLVNKGDRGDLYERFRNRIIFPITDVKNQIIAFGGRISASENGEEKIAKYINSPETTLFYKSKNLYNFHLARPEIFTEKEVVIVEGYMDVISLYQVGIKNVVATLGTALTEHHLQQLWQITDNIIVCLDGDEAGMRAMKKVATSYLKLLKPGKNIKFILLPEKQDPADIAQEHGKDFIKKLLKSSVSLSDILWQITMPETMPKLPEQKAEYESKLMQFVEEISDVTVKNNFRSYFRNKIWQFYNPKFSNKKNKLPKVKHNINILPISKIRQFEIKILLLVFYAPELCLEEEIVVALRELNFSEDRMQNLFDEVLEIVDEYEEKNHSNLKSELEKSDSLSYISRLESTVFVDKAVLQGDVEIKKTTLSFFLKALHLEKIQEEYNKEVKKVTKAEAEKESKKISALSYERLIEMQSYINSLKRSLQEDYAELDNILY